MEVSLWVFIELMEQLVAKKTHRELMKYQETNKVSACHKSLKIELRVTMETIVLWAWLQIEINSINTKAEGENVFIQKQIETQI